MKVVGKIIRLMGMEDSYMLMEMSILENGSKIKLMDMEFIVIWMEQDMKVNGYKTSSKAME